MSIRILAALVLATAITASAPPSHTVYLPAVVAGPSADDARILASLSIPAAAEASLPDAARWNHPDLDQARALAAAQRASALLAWNKLTPAQQEHIKPYLAVKTTRAVLVQTGELPVGGLRKGDYWNCRWVQFERQGFNIFGQVLYGYGLYIQWCYDLSNVVDIPADNRYGYVNTPLWRFDGHIDETKTGGIGQPYYEHYSQGSFCEVWSGLCIDAHYPWVRVRVVGDGSSATDGGGT